MRKSIVVQLKEFRLHWKNYIVQSLLASVTIFIALLIFNVGEMPIMIASIGATAFIMFAMPNNIGADPHNVIGGYISGITIGSLCFLVPDHTYLSTIITYAIAVGISIFVMVVIDVEHPPASGIALSFTINGFSIKPTVSVIVCIIMMSIVHRFLKKHLKDIT